MLLKIMGPSIIF